MTTGSFTLLFHQIIIVMKIYSLAFLLLFKFLSCNQASEFPQASQLPDSLQNQKRDKTGAANIVFKSTDGGQTWTLNSASDIPVTAVSFPTPAVGYMTTWNNVYKTTDSGQTWTKLGLTVGTTYPGNSRFEQAHFTSPDTGFVTSNYYMQVYNTTDGGQTWTSQNPAVYQYDYTAGISFVDKYTGFISLNATGNAMIMKTSNGGKDWNTVWGGQYSNDYFSKIFYIDESTGYGLRYDQVYKTTDSSKTWTPLPRVFDYNRLTDCWFTDKQTGFVINEENYIYVTHDAGATWQRENFDPTVSPGFASGNLHNIKFFNPQIGYLLGGNNFGPSNVGSVFKTVDSGRTWQLSLGYGGNQVEFTPDSNVLIAGFGGMLVKSPVGGWQIDSLGPEYRYPCSETLSASVGVAMGKVDSISFEVRSPDNTIQYINASPALVSNGRITCTAPGDTAWGAGTSYTMRLRFFYQGSYRYSEPVSFTAAGIVKPVITNNQGVLWSSISYGNQWYLDGAPIPNATDNGWTPRSAGIYTVKATQDVCTSAMSDTVMVAGSVNINGFTVIPDSACREKFSATVMSSLDEADSLVFLVKGPDGKTTTIPAVPGTVTGGPTIVSASGNTFASGQTWSASLRLRSREGYRYSDTVTFMLPALPQPKIKDSGSSLISSYTTGNQWYFNTAPVPGAVQPLITPNISGAYAVQATQGACVSPMSEPVKFVAGNLGVLSFPNPVKNQLTILNTQGRTLSVSIVNFNGKTIYSALITAYETIIPTAQLAPGQYVINIVDASTNEKRNIVFIKL